MFLFFLFLFLFLSRNYASQVRGFCVDKSNPEVFDEVNVYGNIYDSELHHMNFAVYTYGHQQGDWRRNTVHSNSGYGKKTRDRPRPCSSLSGEAESDRDAC